MSIHNSPLKGGHLVEEIRVTSVPSRLEIASRVMAGFAASTIGKETVEHHAKRALRWADALIAAAGKETK